MEQVKIMEDSQLETLLSNEFNTEKKFELNQLNYKMFSNVIQKARCTVELQKICSQQRQETTPVNPVENTTNTIETCPRQTNANGTVKSNRIRLLSDIDFVIGFLQYGKISLADAQDLCNKTLKDINTFKNCAKYMEANLHVVKDSEFLATLNGKVNDDDFETMISLNYYILVTGRDLLFKLQETLKNLSFLLKKNVMNYKIISDALSMVSSLPIATDLCDNRDSLFDAIKKADNQITMAHKEESKANRFYDMLQPNLSEMHRKISDFIKLSNKLADIVGWLGFMA